MNNRHFQQLLPFTPLLLLPLLLWKFFDDSQQSLLPWDEGLYMRRARLFLDQNDAWVPFAEAHHKTPGHYWIVALSMRLFGVSDIAARLPFIVLALLSAWLIYEIGSLILSRRAGAMASLILGTSYLWAVHSRTISPDLAYVSFFLGGVLLLVQELVKPTQSSGQFCRWNLYFAGVLFALTIFLRSVLAFLPLVGLMPWLLKQARGRKILTNSWLWLGLACGALPILIWVWKNVVAYGITGFTAPIRFPLRKAIQTSDFPLGGFSFYPFSIFLNFIPWSPLLPFAVTSASLWGGQDIKVRRQLILHRRWLLLAAPVTMLLLLAFTSSQHNNYTLPIYPFAALLIAADLDRRLTVNHTVRETLQNLKSRPQHAPALQSYQAFSKVGYRARGVLQRFLRFFFYGASSIEWRSLQCIVAVYCCLASIVLIFCFNSGSLSIQGLDMETDFEIVKLRPLLTLLSGAWLLGGLMAYWPHRNVQQKLKSWIALHILSSWLVMFGTIQLGFIGNYSPEVKAFLKQPHLQEVLSTAPADLVKIDGRISTLIGAYSVIMGQSWESFQKFKDHGSRLAWVRESDLKELDFPYSVLAQGHGILLIHMQLSD